MFCSWYQRTFCRQHHAGEIQVVLALSSQTVQNLNGALKHNKDVAELSSERNKRLVLNLRREAQAAL